MVQAVYVSGGHRSTAQRVVDAGVPAGRVAGDSCARTTWENATRTNTWLEVHHPGAPVLLLNDPWQMPRPLMPLPVRASMCCHGWCLPA